ncbi:carbohydrate porin [Rhodoferax sp.]|uniref:carbohydrate porin n=1 Tax=Rhodoferax sp. TaxID=50421 RepID=UPI0025E31DCA|nr:carbohydrate porin [Rhodoferax sp.]
MSHILNTALRATALAAMAMVSAAAFAAVDIDANIELDSKVLNQSRGASQSGRVELNGSKKMGSQYFIAGRATYLAHPDGTAGTDDLWAQIGNDTADIKLGRFEAANLFQTPGDVLVDYAGFTPYQANVLRGRQGAYGNGNASFRAAGTLLLGGGFSFELGAVSSKGSGATGLRPVLSYANGPLHLAGGIEAIQYSSVAGSAAGTTTTCGVTVGSACTTTVTSLATPATVGSRQTGFGLTGDYNFGGFTLTSNFASGKDINGLKQSTFALMGAFGNLTVASVFGKAAQATGDDMKVTTFWAAYAIPFFDVKGATITPAVMYSKGSGANSSAPKSSGGAVRVHYDF